MNIKTALCTFAFAGLVAGVTAGTGCGKNDCEDAIARFDAKVVDECGHDNLRRSKPEGEESSEEECSEEEGSFAQCEVVCYEEAECGFDELELSQIVLDCVTACTEAAATG